MKMFRPADGQKKSGGRGPPQFRGYLPLEQHRQRGEKNLQEGFDHA
jgi:hypothetical protein